MSIEKQDWSIDDRFEVSCDNPQCNYSEEFEGDFYEVISEMKSNGWKISKKDGEWNHSCPGCEVKNKKIN
jgi:hypothetical protein